MRFIIYLMFSIIFLYIAAPKKRANTLLLNYLNEVYKMEEKVLSIKEIFPNDEVLENILGKSYIAFSELRERDRKSVV